MPESTSSSKSHDPKPHDSKSNLTNLKNAGFKPLVVALICLALVSGTYLFGYSVGHQNLIFEKGYRPSIARKELGKPKDVNFSLFWDVWQRVNDNFAGKVDNQQMVYDAISGALRSLDDPFTLFLTPDEAKRFSEDLKGSFDGIGAKIESRDGLITVVAPLVGSPAEKAGVRAKDVITKIDDTSTEKLDLQSAIDKIRGAKGTTVKLTIAREGAQKLIEISVTRDVILVKSVEWSVKNNNIGYIELNQFGDDTEALMKQALTEFSGKNLKGLIVDVRNDPGGYLESAVNITSLFLKDREAVVVKEQNKAGQINTEKVTDPAIMPDIPMIVLVNGGSASASEIFAGALQDYKRAQLVGEKTFGKGSVQELQSLPGGAAVRITIAKWLTPHDRQINKLGIAPDIEIKPTDDQIKNNDDVQLNKALELLK